MNRRQFLKAGAAAVAAGMVSGCSSSSRSSSPLGKPLGANSDIRVAVIGFNAHGKSHIKAYKSMPGVRLVALCDVDDRVLQSQAAELEKEKIYVVKYRDLRQLYDDKSIDAVSVVTPNFWHALATVWACQAGKHVCVEKPVSHTIWEGRQMVLAARKYGRLVQADLDARANGQRIDEMSAYLRSGQLGRIVYVRAWNYIRRTSIGKVLGPQQVPSAIDYNLWTGPRPILPLMREKFHYDWHWQWATGNGEIGNNGAHLLDQVRWMLGKENLPRTVMSFGGRYGYIDDGQTPNTHSVLYDYHGTQVIYESRALSESSSSPNMDDFLAETVTGKPVTREHNSPGRHSGHAFFCEGGYLLDGAAYDNDGKEIRRFDAKGATTAAADGSASSTGATGPQARFIAALRSGKISDLKTDILQGHLSAAFCHMGNIALQCGGAIPFEQAKARLARDPQTIAALGRMTKHLTANGVDVTKAAVTLGPTLTMDTPTERFTADAAAQANLFLKDSYREPFVIRDQL
jgi:predicted dehydrogenase